MVDHPCHEFPVALLHAIGHNTQRRVNGITIILHINGRSSSSIGSSSE
jgi:hypothetical protein